MEQELYKTRGTAACIKVSFSHFCNHFTNIFKKIWMPALCLSIALTAVYFPYVRIVSPLLYFGAVIWFYSTFFNMLNKQGMRVNVKKALAITAVIYIFLMAAAGIVWAAVGVLHATPSLARYSWYILIALAGLVSLLCLAFYLPMSNAFMKYAVEDITLKSGFWPSVKMSFRHWGLLFITYFLMGLIISVICIIVMMPYLILTLAQAQSSSGVAMGDPSGLPASFSWLVAVTYALTFFVMAVVAVWPMLTAYFLYGSIEQLEIERKKSEDQTMA